MIFHAAVLMLLDAWFVMYLSIITGQMAYNADIRNFSCTVAIIKHSIYDMLLLDVSTVLNQKTTVNFPFSKTPLQPLEKSSHADAVHMAFHNVAIAAEIP